MSRAIGHVLAVASEMYELPINDQRLIPLIAKDLMHIATMRQKLVLKESWRIKDESSHQRS